MLATVLDSGDNETELVPDEVSASFAELAPLDAVESSLPPPHPVSSSGASAAVTKVARASAHRTGRIVFIGIVLLGEAGPE
ncbi:protein of unknown function (plasmid) [Caballeronia sp. S22]